MGLMSDPHIEKAQGLEADLDSAINLMIRVAKGEQSVQAMARWLSLNYPKRFQIAPQPPQQVDYTPGNH